MRIERARQLLDAGADQPSSNQALQLEVMIRETTQVALTALNLLILQASMLGQAETLTEPADFTRYVCVSSRSHTLLADGMVEV